MAVILISDTKREIKIFSFENKEEKQELIEKMEREGWDLGRHGAVQAEFIRYVTVV